MSQSKPGPQFCFCPRGVILMPSPNSGTVTSILDRPHPPTLSNYISLSLSFAVLKSEDVDMGLTRHTHIHTLKRKIEKRTYFRPCSDCNMSLCMWSLSLHHCRWCAHQKGHHIDTGCIFIVS